MFISHPLSYPYPRILFPSTRVSRDSNLHIKWTYIRRMNEYLRQFLDPTCGLLTSVLLNEV